MQAFEYDWLQFLWRVASSQEMYTEAHEKIREDPTGEPAEKKDCEVAYSLQ